MWAHLTEAGWSEVSFPLVIDGVQHPPNIIALWSEAELAAIGIRRVAEQSPPEGERATGWEIADVDGAPIRRPTGTEPIPSAPVPPLAAWQWETLLDLVPGLRAQVEAAVAALPASPEAIALGWRLRRATTYLWADFAALAAQIGTPAEDLARVEAAWRELAGAGE